MTKVDECIAVIRSGGIQQTIHQQMQEIQNQMEHRLNDMINPGSQRLEKQQSQS